MKRGETFVLSYPCKNLVLDYVSEVEFTLNQSNTETATPTLTKKYPAEVTAEQTDTEAIFYIPINQEESLKFSKYIYAEGQVSYSTDTSASKTDIIRYNLEDTMHTTIIPGNAATVGQLNGIPMSVSAAIYLNVSYETVENDLALSQAAANDAISAKNSAETYKTYASNSATAAAQSATNAEDAKQAIEDMTVSATTLDAGSNATADKTFNPDGTVNIAYGIPRGDTGEQGIQGIQGESGPNEVTTATATNIIGILKGDGSNVQQAVAGTDFPEDTITPVATYIHDSNPEITVSAVDVDTNTFTSVGHGLSDGDTIYPIINQDAGSVYPIAVYAGGLVQTVYGYYVINATTDTFQLSETSGGTAIDITENSTMDLTKWHFEKSTVNTSFTINNLPARKKYKVIVKGKVLQASTGAYIMPNSIDHHNWLNGSSPTYANGSLSFNGDIYNYYECIIDFDDILSISASGIKSSSKNAAENNNASRQVNVANLDYSGINITSLFFEYHNPANGYKVEVYAA
jgi:hypothetical protein